MANRRAVRTKCEDLKERLQDPKLLLYLFFLQAYLPLLSQINLQCQRRNALIFESYSKIQTIVATLTKLIVIDTTLPVYIDEILSFSNLQNVDLDTYRNEGELRFMGREFNDYWKEVQDNSDLTILEQKTVLSNCQAYIVEVAKSLNVRFPEARFILSTCSFISPLRRKHQIVDIQAIVNRFENNYFDYNAVERGYHSYRNDDLLDFLYEDKCKLAHSAEGDITDDIVGFWCDLYQNFLEYKELSKLAILIMTITPNVSVGLAL